MKVAKVSCSTSEHSAKRGKDAVHVSHTAKSAFSIVKSLQRGAAEFNNLISIVLLLRGTDCRDVVPGLGGSDATLAASRERLFNARKI